MATRCRIAKVQDDGTIKSIYCHWDGYPEGVGKTLLEHYTDPDIIDKLIEIGDISSLRDTIEETAKEHYDSEACRKDEDIKEFMSHIEDAGEEYSYIFQKDWDGVYCWKVVETPYAQRLTDVLKERK